MPPTSKESPLVPLDAKTLSFIPLKVGEKVAFHEQHDDQPGMYGLVTDIGLDLQAAGIRFDVQVVDPFVGTVDYDRPTVRVGFEEIQ